MDAGAGAEFMGETVATRRTVVTLILLFASPIFVTLE